jgi:aerobic carbon-monoxide dehydrogenase medium subunit
LVGSLGAKRSDLKPAPFEYFAPETVEEVVSLLADHGDESKVLAGGQSLIPLLALRLASPSVLIDLNRVTSLDYLDSGGHVLKIGALTRHRAVEKLAGLEENCAMVSDAVELVGHVAIRNRGTVVGSMTHADPAAEWPALALALDGEFDVVGPNGARTIPADSFFVTYLTSALEPEELVTEVRLTLPTGRVGSSFVELARRHGDFAVAGTGAVLSLSKSKTIEDARIVLIGVGPTALRARDAEQILVGRDANTDAFEEAAELVQQTIDPTGDIHGSSEFRREIAKVLTRRALISAADRGGGEHG